MRQARHYCDVLLPALREAARSCGYAIAVHGSLERDIDLVAVPWVDMSVSPDAIVGELFGVVTAVFKTAKLHPPSDKPHGRRAWLIQFCGEHFIDLSVMPVMEK